MKRRLDGMRLQLLGLIILPFSLLLLAFAIASVRIHQQAMRRLVAERDERSVRSAAAAMSQQLHHREAAIHALALRLADGSAPATILQEAAYLLEDFDGGIALGERNGKILASTDPAETWSMTPLEQLTDSLPENASGFSSPYAEPDRGTAVVVAARSGDMIAAGRFTIMSLLRTANLWPTPDGQSFSAFVTDSSGRAMISIGAAPAQDHLAAHPGVEAALRGETGSSYLLTEGTEHVVAFSPILPTGWALVIEEPWETVASPILDLSLVAPLALVPALAVALIALWFVARQVIRPLRRLEKTAESLAGGDYEAAIEPVGGIAELRHLQQAMALMARRIQAAQEALRGYISTMTRTQEDERRRLARELHDETIQDLIALNQRVQMVSMNLQKSGVNDPEGLRELHQSTQQAIQRVRRLSQGLRPIYLEDLGLVPALEMLTRDTQAELGIPVSFRTVGDIHRLDPETELAIYRVVQEALSNVARHAQAQNVWMEIFFEDSAANVSIRDDGAGFELPDQTSDLAREGHYGLIGMYERVVLIDGRLEIQSAPGQGTRVSIYLPLGREQE